MAGLSVQDRLQANYDGYYGSERLAEWRRLGAVDKARNIVALCGEYPHDTVIDIGCGDGAVLQRLDEIGFRARYYAVEISESALNVLEERKVDALVEAKRFDGYHVPYPDRHFDLAILSHVVEHVEHPRQLLYDAARVARFVVIEVPLEHTVRLPMDYRFDPVGHINFYADKTIRRLVQTCGYEVLAQSLVDDSREVVVFQHGRKGNLRHLVRKYALRFIPGLAKHFFVYNSILLCKSPERVTISRRRADFDALYD